MFIESKEDIKNVQAQRLDYLDILKFIGILFIYVGHFQDSAGLLYKFVFEFHVPLFFFLSGCTENFNKETKILKNTYKKIKTILIPFYFFALISIVFQILIYGGNLNTVREDLVLLAKGCIRNTYFAFSLWFLSCLFVVSVLFQFIKKLKKPVIIFIVSLVLFILNSLNVVNVPQFYNLKSAFNYQIYYVIGFLCFNIINKVLSVQNLKYKLCKYITGFLAFLYTALLFFGKNIYDILKTINVTRLFFPVLTAITAIWFFMLVAYAMRNCDFLARLGKSSLYFCGNEYIVKRTVYSFISSFVNINITNGATALIYSFLLMLFSQRFVVPIETEVIEVIKKKVDFVADGIIKRAVGK